MNGETAERKKEARARAAERLDMLSDADWKRISAGIAHGVLSHIWYREAKCVFCFVGAGRETDTRMILQDALAAGKTLCVPRCRRGGVMEACRIGSLSDLRPGFFSIPEPDQNAPAVPREQIDLILVPCLAATPKGVRLGRGGGYYDRYLEGYHGHTLLLCPKALLFEDLPSDVWDRPAEHVLTEDGEAFQG